MRIRGYRRVRELIVDQKARRFVASLDRSDYVVPDNVKERLRGKLNSMLDENILPFWFPDCLDLEFGGYRSECSITGEWQPFRDKNIISQSRILWFTSRLIRFGRTSADNLRWAQHGFAFLKDHFWDDDYGGFFWEIDFENKRPTKPNKHLCGQAFGLHALSEFALATGDSDARSMADQLFELLDRHAHDPAHGGYLEYLARDWTPVHSREPHYMGHPPDIKQVNTHVHLMEAFTLYERFPESELVRNRLTQLVMIQSSAVVRKQGVGCTEV
ncbi:MAG: AGE family epimerase/isomerase, partial [Rhodothermia bacterium]